MTRIRILLIALFILVFIYVYSNPTEQPERKSVENEYNKNKVRYEKIDNHLRQIKGIKNLKINPTESYNYLNKEDVYKTREKHVKNSIFYTDDYSPSNQVFGQIEDKKPWYGLKYYNCATNAQGKNEITLGDSEESRFINNPDMLIGINQWVYKIKDANYKKEGLCTNLDYSKMLKDLTFNPDKNTIIATFKRPEGGTFNLVGINARDFGYNYIFAEKIENVEFLDKGNISKGVYKLQDFIHTGSSCGLTGGCNNTSPRQVYLDFKVKNNLKAKMNLKLWRKEPKTPFDKADINYSIVFYTY